MASIGDWAQGARPQTLTAALSPVLVGTSVSTDPELGRFLLTLCVAFGLQIGVNFANDYSDGIKGTDTERVGPKRLVASGAAPPKQVLTAAIICFTGAAVAGFFLAMWVTWWLIPIGAVAILAAYFYTGGSRPYGYFGFGEVAVMLFFGFVATAGTAYIQTEKITGLALLSSAGVGSVACALLVANNVRDMPKDRLAKKRTLAVMISDKFGDISARLLYPTFWLSAAVFAISASVVRPFALLALIACALAIVPTRKILNGDSSPFPLAATGALLALYGVTLAIGIAIQ